MSEFKIKVGVELDASDLKSKLKGLAEGQEIEVKLDMSKITSQIKEIKSAFKDAFKVDSKFANDLKAIANTLKKLNNNPLNDPVGGGGSGKPLNSLMQQYKELYKLRERLQKQMASGKLGDDSIARTSEQIARLTKQMSALKNSMSDSQKAGIELFDAKQSTKAMVDMNNYLNKIDSQADKIRKTIGNIDMSNLSDGSKAELNDVLDGIERIQNEAKDVRLDFDVSGSMNQLRDYEDTVKRIKNEAKEIDKSSHIGSRGLNGMFGTWDDFKSNFAQFTLAEMTGDMIADGIRVMARGFKDTIVETDSAITDLNKVYEKGLSGDNLKSYLGTFTEVAKATGKSSVDVIQGTTKAVQSGIGDLDQAITYATKASMLSNVGDIEQGQADTMLASIMSAYGGVENSIKPVREQITGMGKDYDTLTKFIDLANYSGNNFAVSTADVGEALQNSAAALQTNGVSMEQSVAMAVAMNEIVQDAGKSGNALKTMSANFSGLTTSAKDGSIQLTKAGKTLKEIAGIDVWNEQTGEVKDMFTVADELYNKWDSLSEAQRTALGSAVAGKTQLNTFNALMSNWETARQLVDEYNQGLTIGSAEKEKQYSPYVQKCA